MKWKLFLPIWLVAFLLAPSVLIHRLFMFQTPPPGSNLPGPPLFIPFGGIYFLGELWGQLVRGDFMDSLVLFIFLVLPILIYTFVISLIIYYCLRKLWQIKESKALSAR